MCIHVPRGAKSRSYLFLSVHVVHVAEDAVRCGPARGARRSRTRDSRCCHCVVWVRSVSVFARFTLPRHTAVVRPHCASIACPRARPLSPRPRRGVQQYCTVPLLYHATVAWLWAAHAVVRDCQCGAAPEASVRRGGVACARRRRPPAPRGARCRRRGPLRTQPHIHPIGPPRAGHRPRSCVDWLLGTSRHMIGGYAAFVSCAASVPAGAAYWGVHFIACNAREL